MPLRCELRMTIITSNHMIKQKYQTPLTELYEIKTEGALLATSVDSVMQMNSKLATWDDDDEYDY